MKKKQTSFCMPHKCITLIMLLCTFMTNSGQATETQNANKLKAILAAKIMKFTQWPAQNNNAPIRFGILGKDKVSIEFEKLDSINIGNRKLTVKKILNNNFEPQNYDAVYISRFNSLKEAKKLETFNNTNTLTFCSDEIFFRKGAMIYLTTKEKKIHFLVNPDIHSQMLRIPSKVLRLAANKKQLSEEMQAIKARAFAENK